MGKCVRIRGSSKPPPAAAASCLTLRSGRRVLAASSAACSPRTSGRPRRHRGSALRRWCGAEAATANKHGSPRRRGAADAASPKELYDDGRPEEEVPLSRSADTGAAAVARGGDGGGRGDSFERPKTPPLMTDDCDAAAAKAKAKHENESRRKGVVAGQPPPTEAEIEAFFAAAELAERRRFAEA
ncbi:unnamed protein product [Miscanthus lutarioriparius]|uniref:Cyclin-dependent kinase inhibitor n=1 Tax=Miscanthus lutarioriparius TaxID=422564 RepID=A0A811QAK6_9POAL|nr:unnamed protein product [Miscanthus lutarioriparius]